MQSITLDPTLLQTLATLTRETGVEWVPKRHPPHAWVLDGAEPMYFETLVLILNSF